MARPKMAEGKAKSVKVQIRLTPEEKAKFLALGGSKSVRKMIAEANPEKSRPTCK